MVCYSDVLCYRSRDVNEWCVTVMCCVTDPMVLMSGVLQWICCVTDPMVLVRGVLQWMCCVTDPMVLCGHVLLLLLLAH